MAQKTKRKRKAASRPSSLPPTPSAAAPIYSPEPTKGRIRQAGDRLLDSAIDTALQAVWLGIAATIGGMALTALVTIILYLRAPESAWVYTLLKYALVHASGMLTLLLYWSALLC